MGAGAAIGGDIQDNGYLVIARAGVAACRSRQDIVSRRAVDRRHTGPLRPHTGLAALWDFCVILRQISTGYTREKSSF